MTPNLTDPNRFLLHGMLAALLGWTLSSPLPAQPNPTPQQPNIVFIFSDDHALDAISAYSDRLKNVAPTPNIDSLAREGALFYRSYCTNSICGPSRASIQTGKHSHKNGFMRNGDLFDNTQDTFPKRLQAAGYHTAIIGKWHLKAEPTGYDYWEVLPGQGHYYRPEFKTANGSVTREGYVTDVITDRAIDWLENRDSDKPFLLMCQHKAPHRNWAPAQRHLTLFDNVEIPEPKTLFDNYANRADALKANKMEIGRHMHWQHDFKFHGKTPFPDIFRDEWGNGEYQRMTTAEKAAWDRAYEPKNQAFIDAYNAGKLSPEDVLRWKYQRYMKDYLRTIRAMDENIGRLLLYLEDAGLNENTIVIYSSDQGFYLGEHGWFDKRWMFEESLSMPFIIRWPGVVTPGRQVGALIQNIDYAPTFLEVAGAKIPDDIQGRSLVPLLTSDTVPEDWRQSIYYAYYHNAGIHNVAIHDGIRTNRYKLMYLPESETWQLFDLKTDPDEMQDRYHHPEYQAVRKTMTEKYHEVRQRYDAVDLQDYIRNNPPPKGG